jgi:hypothetical protein
LFFRISQLMLNNQYSLPQFDRHSGFIGIIYRLIIIAIIVFFGINQANGQQKRQVGLFRKDSAGYHSATKATYYSMMLPGLGQAYNKKYWKIPIIYAGFGTLAYLINANGSEYRKFRTAYNIVATDDTLNFTNDYVVRYGGNLDQLREGRNYYRRNLEFNYILTVLLYILNIVDASVDGNLYDFDVSDDISIKFEPVRNDFASIPEPAIGLTLRFRF